MRLPQLPFALPTFALLLAALGVSGCGPPAARFVYNAKTEELAPEAGEPVKTLVDGSFGTPAVSIAWLKMPVDFGTITGRVTDDLGRQEDAYRFQVKFDAASAGSGPVSTESGESESESGSAAPLDVGQVNFTGLAVRWTSGKYALGSQIAGGPNAGGYAYALTVTGFEPDPEDANAGVLTLGQRMQPPPAKGATFEIIGHKLSAGRQLYAAHCQHCHGVSGDGNGPTARYLTPKPRDYRHGKFKFKSTVRVDRPTDADLERTIRQGIPGTYMPSFLLLEDRERKAIVQYVKWLSMRGEYELGLVNRLYTFFEQSAFDKTVAEELKSAIERYEANPTGEPPTEESVRAMLAGEGSELSYLPETEPEVADGVQTAWLKVDNASAVVLPSVARSDDTPASWAKGRVLFIKNCAACHGATGRGDGEQVEAYMVNDQTRERYPEPGLFDDWGQPISPRNLRLGIYRGGRRPLDLYRRVFEGINGTPMPPFKGKIPDAEIWDVVNYVYHLPFEGERPAASSGEDPRETASVEKSTR